MDGNLKTVLVGMALVLTQLSFGSNDYYTPRSKKDVGSKFRLGLSFLPSVTNYTSVSDPVHYTMNALPSFSGGVSFYKNLGNNISLESGLWLTRWSYQTEAITFLPPDLGHNISPGNNPFLEENEVYAIDKYHFVESPLLLSYRKRMGRFALEIGGGASAAIRVYETSRAYDYTTGEHFQNYTNNALGQSIHFRWMARLGLEYCVSDFFAVRLDPIYMRDITSFEPAYDGVTNTSGSLGKLHDYGIKIGLISNLSFSRRNG